MQSIAVVTNTFVINNAIILLKDRTDGVIVEETYTCFTIK